MADQFPKPYRCPHCYKQPGVEHGRFCILTGKVKRPPVGPTAGVLATADWLLADDMQALRRFCETCEDSQPYDVPKDRMRRLAELGVIQWCGGARYSITAFGQHVLDLLPEGWPRLPLKTHADHDVDSRAAFNAAHGVGSSCRCGLPQSECHPECPHGVLASSNDQQEKQDGR